MGHARVNRISLSPQVIPYNMNDEELEQKAISKGRQVKAICMRVEIIIGIIAIICGAALSIMVMGEGYFAGALMLVMTGIINIFLAIKELVDPSDGEFHWLPLFFMIVRRAMFFLNVVLIALVIGTMTELI